MASKDFEIRDGEKAVELPSKRGTLASISSAASTRLGRSARIARRTPAESEAVCMVELDPRWHEGLKDVETCTHLVLLYWMDRSPRDLVLQVPVTMAFSTAPSPCARRRGQIQSP